MDAIKLYLITGFLGAGKTTFLKNFLPLFAGRKIAILVNEFGKEGVDGKLLSGLAAELSEITGGSVFCSCLSGVFEDELGKIVSKGPDVILIESSGLSDPTGIQTLLNANPGFNGIEYSGCICLADCARFPKVFKTAASCRKQLAAADVLVLNKLDLANEEEIAAAIELIRANRHELPIIKTSFGRLPETADKAAASGDISLLLKPPAGGGLSTGLLCSDISLRSITIELDACLSSAQARKILGMIGEDSYRMKGFLSLSDGQFLADCVAGSVNLTPFENDSANNHIMVLYGQGLRARKAVEEAIKWYPGRLRLV